MSEPISPSATLAERIVIVLVEPQHPGNVGSTARAMKNMGLRRLVVVNPAPSFDPERARWMAPGADALWPDVKFVATLEEGLEGVHRAIAATARHRRDGQRVMEPPAIAESIFDDDRVTAILFGREDFGLDRESVAACESILRIATDHHASLNLSQAVLLTCHHLFEEARRRGHRADGRLLGGDRRTPRSTRSLTPSGGKNAYATANEVEPAITELVALLQRVGFTKATSPEKVAVLLREAMQRSAVSRKHVYAMRGMVSRVEYALDHPELDWQTSLKQKKALDALRAKESNEE